MSDKKSDTNDAKRKLPGNFNPEIIRAQISRHSDFAKMIRELYASQQKDEQDLLVMATATDFSNAEAVKKLSIADLMARMKLLKIAGIKENDHALASEVRGEMDKLSGCVDALSRAASKAYIAAYENRVTDSKMYPAEKSKLLQNINNERQEFQLVLDRARQLQDVFIASEILLKIVDDFMASGTVDGFALEFDD